MNKQLSAPHVMASIHDVVTINNPLQRSLTVPPRPSRKRVIRRTKSFTCSAKDFVPQRTDRFEDNYDLCEMLGEGAYGEVYVCRHQLTGSERAVKIIDKTRMCEAEYEEVINEFQILKQIDNPNVIRMYEFFDVDNKFYIVQELARGGELYDELDEHGTLPEQDVARLIKQVLSCLKYLAKNNIVHRDLNLENIMLDESKDYEQLKVIDFGLATTLQEGQKITELVGKVHYLAPEVMEGSYGPKYDVWSAGIITYILLAGFAPFDAELDSDVRQLIMEGKVSFDDPEWEHISEEAKDFVRQLLTYEEDSRPSAEEALRHPWIADAIRKSSDHFRQQYSNMAADALSNLRAFNSSSKLKQATCSFIASQLLERDEREELDRIFRGFDQDCDGKLSMDDLQCKYKEFNNSELSDQEMAELFDQCDLSGSNFLDYSEFVVASMNASELLDDKKLRAAFDHYDPDHTGYITAKSLMESMSNVADERVADKIIRQVDCGNDGLISFEDFKNIMTQNNEPTERAEEADTGIDVLLQVASTESVSIGVEDTEEEEVPQNDEEEEEDEEVDLMGKSLETTERMYDESAASVGVRLIQSDDDEEEKVEEKEALLSAQEKGGTGDDNSMDNIHEVTNDKDCSTNNEPSSVLGGDIMQGEQTIMLYVQ
ncbi:MAP kinase-activated protein kinase 2 (Fragment) [Seminavis robusta]|uniref:non-specific serine/threonine protein kinase n=1 Tax=Seminavis robusta TaxID=568900 RepID=A0A9N8D8W4_9STRA